MKLTAARDFVRLLSERFVATRCPQVAGSLAFTTLLAIVPLVTVTIALFSNFPAFSRVGLSLRQFLLDNLLPERAGRIIATYAVQFSEQAAELTVLGTAMLVVTALMLLLTIDQVFNRIWGVRRARPLLTRLAVHWFALTIGPLALGAGILSSAQLVASSVALAGAGAWLGDAAARALPPALLAVVFSFLYYAVPNHPVRALHALAGGVAAAVVFVLMQRLFGVFIVRFPSYTLIYGTFAALPIFLVWLYLSWVVILLGAILSATLPAFFERHTVVKRFPGDRAWGALAMLLALAEAQREGHARPFEELRERAGVSSTDGEALLGEMQGAGWVIRTEEGQWVLSRDADRLGLAEVIDRFALSPAAWQAASNPGDGPATAAQRLATALRACDVPLATLIAPRERATADQMG